MRPRAGDPPRGLSAGRARGPAWSRVAVALGLAVGAGKWPGPADAHPHDSAYLKGASARLLEQLEARTGAALLQRVADRLCEFTLSTLPAGIDRERAIELAREVVPRELQLQVCQWGKVEEVGEILLSWGGDLAPDPERSARIFQGSVPTVQMVRVLRARIRRVLRLGPAAASGGPFGSPLEAVTRPGVPRPPPRMSEADLSRARAARLEAGISAPATPGGVQLPLLRFDADGDGYAETCGVDADLDGAHERFDADLDGDRVFESRFVRRDGAWSVEDAPEGKSLRG